MLKIYTQAFVNRMIFKSITVQRRKVSALYVTGDKAKENNAIIYPYMDFKQTFQNREELQNSISRRKSSIDLSNILEKYKTYNKFKEEIQQLDQQRAQIAVKLRNLSKSEGGNSEIEALKEQGISLRNSVKSLKEKFYPIEDDFIHSFLDIPNLLHKHCPSNGEENILYRSNVPRIEEGEMHLKRTDLIRFEDNSRYYLFEEAAEFDYKATQALLRYFVFDGDFIPMSNPDFVRAILLEANATPMDDYHMVMEQNLINKLNPSYLVGGGSFESFLGAVTKLCVYPNVIPLRCVSSGRSYHKARNVTNATTENLFTAIQTNAVQTFAAATNQEEADALMEEILNLAIDFYKALNIHFRIVYADASDLKISENLRAVIEAYSPVEKRFISVGHVSNYADFVSKRILFSMQKEKENHFLHIVGGPVLETTRLIGLLIEQNIPLEKCKLLGAFEEEMTYDFPVDVKPPEPIDKFRKLFE
ncbi:serine--tRNA synthetase-like protein Slimp [Teleopsis dalmanni]|uniref:serine--tRNA synthetase-like protein Slimp n=1 Tax=Teleopsis dalmanni TaxID=139649 RepID=UPI000D3293BF|nr:serine--tRNA synthetase-like protein Slimp [Teleopsis dalmanni]